MVEDSAGVVTPFSAKHDLRSGGRRVELVGLDAEAVLPQAAGDRDRGVRPGAGRRAGGGLGDPDRRRSGDRQIDPAVASGREGRGARRSGCLYFRRGGGRSGAAAGAPARAGRGTAAPRGGDLGARHSDDAGRERAARSGGDRFDPDDVFGPDRGRAGDGEPGPRLGPRADPLRQGERRGDRAGRPCHQGRRDRGAARARAYGRHGAELRGRAQPSISHPARRPRTASAAPTRSACSRWARRGWRRFPTRRLCS